MKRIALASKKLLGRSESGQQIGSEKTGATEKELVEAPKGKPAKQK